MSKTLFWYIFLQLLRVFMMAAGALAGMMSFAGLLRPLTENGLDFMQVNHLLIYLTPAMGAYSLPVAALFATSVVYGRLSADNELIAMRAGGISYLSPRRFGIALPALVLGLLAAVIMLVLLCFVVPIYSLKVEQVIYSNIAQVIAGRIQRTHEIQFPGVGQEDTHIFAESAELLTSDPHRPDLQRVKLVGPVLMKSVDIPTTDPQAQGPTLRVPREFWMAREAYMNIQHTPGSSSPALLTVQLFDGVKFPRQFEGNVQAGVASTSFGPEEIPSPIQENVKFMDVEHLAAQAHDPGKSQKVQEILRKLNREREIADYLTIVGQAVCRPDRALSTYQFADAAPASSDEERFVISAQNADSQVAFGYLNIRGAGKDRTVVLTQTSGSQVELLASAREMHVLANPNPANRTIAVSVEMYDISLETDKGNIMRQSFIRSFIVPMPPEILKLEDKTLADYQIDPNYRELFDGSLFHEQIVANNAARAELNGRASFAISCLTLVMVGCGLGTMFRSGNFLNAFAVSFIPALLCITLIICGEQAAVHVPYTQNPANPLNMALTFIWVGNLAVLAVALALTVHLQRR